MSITRGYIFTFLVFTVLSLISVFTSAMAQQNSIGYLGKGKDQYSVFIFGDALAGGLWAGTARMAEGHPRLKLNGRYREGSGLAKPRIYNWAERLPATLENRKVDIAIILIGINDAQDIRKQGAYLAFNSDQWREVYTASVAKMMGHLTDNKTAVYWFEIPPVKRSDLDQRLKVIADIHRQEASKAGIRFVDIRKEFTTSTGEFTLNGAGVSGNTVRLRSRNGIRFIKTGNNKLASIVLKQIDQDIAIADGERSASDFPVPDSSNIASSENGPYSGPIFGSSGSDKQALLIEPKNLPIAGLEQSNNVLIASPTFGGENQTLNKAATLTGDQVLKNLKSEVNPDSAAYSLFSEGIWPKTTEGRLDDFSQSAN